MTATAATESPPVDQTSAAGTAGRLHHVLAQGRGVRQAADRRACAARGGDVYRLGGDSQECRLACEGRGRDPVGPHGRRGAEPDFEASDVCREELDHAVEHNKRLVPISLPRTSMQHLSEELDQPNWIFSHESDDFESTVDELVEAVESDLDWLHQHARLLDRAREERGRNCSLLRGSDLRRGGLAREADGARRGGDGPPGRVHRRELPGGVAPLPHHAQRGRDRVDLLARARRTGLPRVAAVGGQRAQREVARPRLGRPRAAPERSPGQSAARGRGDEDESHLGGGAGLRLSIPAHT